jgi:hypothetical protein
LLSIICCCCQLWSRVSSRATRVMRAIFATTGDLADWRAGVLSTTFGRMARPTTGRTLALPRADASLPNNQTRGIGTISFMPTQLPWGPKCKLCYLRDAR